MEKGYLSVFLLLVAVSHSLVKNAEGKDDVGKDAIDKETVGKDAIDKEAVGKDAKGKDAIGKDAVGKESTTMRGTRKPQTLSRGWGDNLQWMQTYEEALFKSKHSNRPLMVINHRENCPHSQALKKAFAAHKSIQKLAHKFILLNVVHDPTDKNLLLDGQYVPKIVFVDPSMVVRGDIPGKYSNHLYTYEPNDVELLYNNMKKALHLLKTEL
uniref:Anterior gradient protein 2-A-like n=1 Tax=Geotrypetes seraphini TaxID=260995 RepID=A0A6P8PX29_GEOSA|nr:anterior gradient protein 2-A-like [Geotrypetes seraphini]